MKLSSFSHNHYLRNSKKPRIKIRYCFFLLSTLALLSLSRQYQAVAQESVTLTGSWVGVYTLPEQIDVFFIEWKEGENGRFQTNQSFRSQPIHDLHHDSQQLQFTANANADTLVFSGTWVDGAFVGDVGREGENGRFYLTPLAPISTDLFDTTIGSYDIETEPPVLISRADQINQLFYQQGNQQIRLYPIGENKFLTALGELFILKAEQIEIENALTPESTAIQTGTRTTVYQEEPISFPNGTETLSGSLFLPVEKGPFPAVILLHGSGAAERHFYRIFADLFARNGIAALIFDKRGYGTSTGQSDTATLQNLADDARAGIQFLAHHDKIDTSRIGVWGFSQGGRILPMVAAKNKDVAFAIVVSAPAMSTNTLNLWRQDRQQRAGGKSEQERSFLLQMNQLQQSLPWQEDHVDEALEPLSFWKDVTQPTLLIYGSEDSVVPSNDSANAILASLKQAGNTTASLTLFINANHDIMLNETAVPTFAPDYFDTLVAWIQDGYPLRTAYSSLEPTGEFTENGRYAPFPWYKTFWIQVILILLICGVLLITAIRSLSNYRHKRA